MDERVEFPGAWMPLKPVHNPQTLEFGPGGPRLVIHELPRDRAQLELAVAQRFVRTLRERKERPLSEAEPIHDEYHPADARANELDAIVEMQLAEVYTQADHALEQSRSTYEGALQQSRELATTFAGHHIVVRGGAAILPIRRHGRDGKRVVDELVRGLLALAAKHAERPFRFAGRELLVGPERARITLGAEPFADTSQRMRVQWIRGQALASNGAPGLLETIDQKLAKNYAKTNGRQFWLVLWTVGGLGTSLFFEPSHEVYQAAKRLLLTNHGPFDEVWFTAMLGDSDAEAYKLYPVPPDTILGPPSSRVTTITVDLDKNRV